MAKEKSTKLPEQMTLEEIEAEVAALLAHQERISQMPPCTREVCSGEPHSGAQYPHEPRFRQEPSPLALAQSIDQGYRSRPHLAYLSERLSCAVADVEGGTTRYMTVSMPPRMGKSQQISVYLTLWLLSKHPEWKIGLISHSPTLATIWGRQVRRVVEEYGNVLGIEIASDAGAVQNWETTKGGSVSSRSAPGQSITGVGFNVMIVDDPVKDFADAHSEASRDAIWDWWKANAFTRLEPPALVIVVGTRWHEDDFIGRLLSKEHDGDPDDWEVISFPAIAEKDDVLGRAPGEPLYSPLVASETKEEALARWEKLKRAVGSYTWAALYQQRPAPPEGAIFSMDWWKFWTNDPELADPLLADGTVNPDAKTIYVNPSTLSGGTWLDSWDTSFKGTENSDYVVGQRWVRMGPKRYLIAQQRGRWGFTVALSKMLDWTKNDDPALSPYGKFVHKRLIEDAANGPAIIEKMREKVSGIKPVNPRASKEARARAVSPEIESGDVYLPHPSMTGYEWVNDLIAELREFPNGVHDDQVDSLTQALGELRETGVGGIVMPGETTAMKALQQPGGLPLPGLPGGLGNQVGGDRLSAARTMRRMT